MQTNTLQNYTRLPIGILSSATLGWASPESVSGLYGPRPIRAFRLTELGMATAEGLASRKDVRSADLEGLSLPVRADLANFGYYEMLDVSGIQPALIADERSALEVALADALSAMGVALDLPPLIEWRALSDVDSPNPCTQWEPFVYTQGMNTATNSLRVIGYARVSTAEQHDAGAGLPAQIARLNGEATGRGWELELVTEDGGRSGGSLDKRTALVDALARLDRGEADALVVTKLDRLTRSVADFSRLLDRARRRGWQLVVLDLGIDTTTPAGELVANVIASAAQYEKRMIGLRTREGMAQRKAEGVHCGRPATLPADVVERIVAEKAAGRSLRGIAHLLNADAIPTAHGGAKWYGSTIKTVLASKAAA